MTLTKAELADLLFEKVGFNKREAKDMVESFFEEVRTALEDGKGVKLSGFGNFQLRDKPQRPGRNPKTGEEIPITSLARAGGTEEQDVALLHLHFARLGAGFDTFVVVVDRHRKDLLGLFLSDDVFVEDFLDFPRLGESLDV